jgi:hypothetical protein
VSSGGSLLKSPVNGDSSLRSKRVVAIGHYAKPFGINGGCEEIFEDGRSVTECGQTRIGSAAQEGKVGASHLI